MKKLLSSILLAIAVTSVQADPITELCRAVGSLAKTTIEAKSSGVPLAKILEFTRQTPAPPGARELAESTIKAIYSSETIHPDDAEMVAYIACMRNMGGRQ